MSETADLTAPPVIDLSNFAERRSQIVDELMHAATTVGFFYIAGHGIPQSLIDSAFKQAKGFFDLPQDKKDCLPKVDWASAKVIGYELNELKDGTLHESFMQAYEVHEQMKKSWPSEADVPEYRTTSLEFMHTMRPVAARLLSCFATGLGLPENYFEQTIDINSDDNKTFLQYHKYPTTEGLSWKPGTNRITAHTDESLITLLYPSPGSVGLELAAGKDGQAVPGLESGYHKVERWMPCPQREGTIVVNVGDPLQIISDGVLRSNYHRVRMPKPDEPQGDRYSMGYFVWPRLHDSIQGKSGKEPATTMAKYMQQKGKIFAESFSPDIERYENAQQYAFGPPQVSTTA